jgi:AcrR family transcriptional regulator
MSRTPARLAQRKKACFLEALARTGNVTASCESAGLPRETAYYWKSRDPVFSEAWDEALERGLDALEDEVMRRAKDGVVETVFYQGRAVGERRRYSDPLAMFILKSRRRHVWGEHQQVDVKSDFELLSKEERMRKAEELIEMIADLREPPPKPLPLVYRPEEPDESDEK